MSIVSHSRVAGVLQIGQVVFTNSGTAANGAVPLGEKSVMSGKSTGKRVSATVPCVGQ